MADNLISNGDFQSGNVGWTCGPGCTIQAQHPCTDQCAMLQPPQTLSQQLNLDQNLVNQPMNLTLQVLATSPRINPKSSSVNIMVTVGNATVGHSFPLILASGTGSFSTYSQIFNLTSTITPIIIHIEDSIGAYDSNVYIQRVSLASPSSNELPTPTLSPTDIRQIIKEAGGEQVKQVLPSVVATVGSLTLLLLVGGIWLLRRQNRLEAQKANPTLENPPNNTTYELPEVKNQMPLASATRQEFPEPVSHPPLEIETANSQPMSAEVPRSPVEYSPEHPQRNSAEASPSMVDDQIGQYALVYRDKISKELEAKLRAAGFEKHHNPDALSEDLWLRRFSVGPFELQRLRELFYGRRGRIAYDNIPGDVSRPSLHSAYPYPRDISTPGAEQLSLERSVNLEDWSETHREMISRELEDRLRAACYLPSDDPDRLPAALWQARFGVGLFELEILRELFRRS